MIHRRNNANAAPVAAGRAYDQALARFRAKLDASPVPFRVYGDASDPRGLMVRWPANSAIDNSAVPGQIAYSFAGSTSGFFRYVVERSSVLDGTQRSVILVLSPSVLSPRDAAAHGMAVRRANALALITVRGDIPDEMRAFFDAACAPARTSARLSGRA